MFETNDSSLQLRNLTISNGNSDYGAGMRLFANANVTISRSTISNNTASIDGGGIFAQYSDSSLSVENSTISNNTAVDGGGVFSFSGATTTISNSTVTANTGTSIGGGIYANNSTMNIDNSTLSGNSAGTGAGIASAFTSVVRVRNSTISANTATVGGALRNSFGTSLSFENSIVSGNIASAQAEIFNQSATLTADNNNIFTHSGVSDAGAFSGFLPGASDVNASSDGDNIVLDNILLAELAENGGTTLTHSLPDGSPAIDAADTQICTDIGNLDQRGQPRDANCDIGALEIITATITVDNAGDSSVGCTLRDAASITNSFTAYYDPDCAAGADRNLINFDPQVFTDDGDNIITISDQLVLMDKQLTIMGGEDQNITIDADGNSRVMYINESAISLNNLTLTGGDNEGSSGGGILAQRSVVTLDQITVSENTARYGGGIEATDSKMRISNSTISNNSANTAGGGIDAFNTSEVYITNSTVSANTSTNYGGGVNVASSSFLLIANTTITQNYAGTIGGGFRNGSDAFLANNIVAGNTAGGAGNEIYDQNGGIDNDGNNLLGHSLFDSADAFAGLGNFIPEVSDIDASRDEQNIALNDILSPDLADNGGPTFTHALPANSLAVDGGSQLFCEDQDSGLDLVNDQRGEPRDRICDIGAYEFIDGEVCYVVPTGDGNKVVVFCL